jgi:trans-aconitate methyltransferase
MISTTQDFSGSEHDWHSDEYVAWWIERDAGRDAERRQRLRQMLALAPFPADAAVAVLDVGGGYGVLTEEVLRALPRARLTLQDYSQPMLDAARRRLGAAAERVTCVFSDLRDPGWTASAGGPFDLVVSSIAIHNLRDLDRIAACYRGIAGLLKPGAPFLDYDIFDVAGGVSLHTRLLQEAGFARVELAWEQAPAAILAAYAPPGAG